MNDVLQQKQREPIINRNAVFSYCDMTDYKRMHLYISDTLQILVLFLTSVQIFFLLLIVDGELCRRSVSMKNILII